MGGAERLFLQVGVPGVVQGAEDGLGPGRGPQPLGLEAA